MHMLYNLYRTLFLGLQHGSIALVVTPFLALASGVRSAKLCRNYEIAQPAAIKHADSSRSLSNALTSPNGINYFQEEQQLKKSERS